MKKIWELLPYKKDYSEFHNYDIIILMLKVYEEYNEQHEVTESEQFVHELSPDPFKEDVLTTFLGRFRDIVFEVGIKLAILFDDNYDDNVQEVSLFFTRCINVLTQSINYRLIHPSKKITYPEILDDTLKQAFEFTIDRFWTIQFFLKEDSVNFFPIININHKNGYLAFHLKKNSSAFRMLKKRLDMKNIIVAPIEMANQSMDIRMLFRMTPQRYSESANLFIIQKDIIITQYKRKRTSYKNQAGYRYIQYLLEHPNEIVDVFDLINIQGELLKSELKLTNDRATDKETVEAVINNLKKIRDRILEFEEQEYGLDSEDLDELTKLEKEEHDEYSKYLKETTYKGRIKQPTGNPYKKALDRVNKAINAAIKSIEEKDSVLFRHLSIIQYKKGQGFIYDVEDNPCWITS